MIALLCSTASPAARPDLGGIDPATAYVTARAAAFSGDHARSARLFAALAEARGDEAITRRAIGEAISAGDFALALRLTRAQKLADLGVDAKLLMVAEQIRAGRNDRAAALLAASSQDGDAGLAAVKPLVDAWAAADRNRAEDAVRIIGEIPATSLISSFLNEQRAFLLLKLRRPAEAEPFARRAIGSAGGREQRLRLAFADGYLAAGDRSRAYAMLEGMGTEAGRARLRVQNGQQSGLAVDSTAKAYSELLAGLAVDLTRTTSRGLPVSIAQVAHYVAPDNASAAVILGVLLEGDDRLDEALAAFRAIPGNNGLAASARDAEVRALISNKRLDQALRTAQGEASARDAGVSDFARLGDVLSALDRFDESAAAYQRALALTDPARPMQRWPLLLLQASALESANRWQESKAALNGALALAPEQPLILNFLGYAKLERGEDLDAAEAMIRKASAIAPDDASITDSLGWAQFKRGRLGEAIETLQRAALTDPNQAEIHEHLGDALYAAGRRFEARFAWEAGMVTADDEVAKRLRAKIAAGPSPASAAP